MAFENAGNFQPFNLSNVAGQAANINNTRLQNTRLSNINDPQSTANQRDKFDLEGLKRRGSLEEMATDTVRAHAALSAGNIQGFESLAGERLQRLEERKLIDPSVNTDDTQRILQIARKNPEQALKILAADIDGFRQAGILKGADGGTKPTSNIQDFNFVKGLNEEDQKLFKGLLRGAVVKTIAGIPTVIGPEVNTPLSTLQEEVDAKASLAAGTETGKAGVSLKFDAKIAESVELAKAAAKDKGEAFNKLNEAKAALPGIKEAAEQLKDLALISTNTAAGRFWDTIVQESGFGATEGGTARAKFISIIDNQVLPLLKPTFGGSFSIQEGESLKATLGDPNATPEAKLAAIDAYLAQVQRNIETQENRLEGQNGQGQEAEEDLTAMTIEQLIEMRNQAQ